MISAPSSFLRPVPWLIIAALMISPPGCGTSDPGSADDSSGGGGGDALSGGSDSVAADGEADEPGGDAAGDAGPAGTDGGPGGDPTGCECVWNQHCTEDGLCAEDVCVKGASTCATPTTVQVCADDGASKTEVPCDAGEICEGGECTEPLCTPDEQVGCEDGKVLVCNSIGTGTFATVCPNGQGCVAGACQVIQPNVLLLVDTSSSMNWTPSGNSDNPCPGQSCTPWLYPNCDDPAAPKRRLGLVKQALTELVNTESVGGVRLALQRFPQRAYTANAPKCDGGYWTQLLQLEGDDDFHSLSKPFLAQTLWQTVVHPFAEAGDTDVDALAQWFDFEEALADTSTPCADNAECGGTPCLGGHCQVYVNPELWGFGLTPLGKTLFYAGEYYRHFVLVEGKACEADADCGSAAYHCEEGACHDPFRECRPNVVIAFTDGEESEHFYTNDFFHPRVQAKRLHYGLGCESDADCAGGATCEDWVCRPPPGEVDEAGLICDGGGTPCQTNSDCKAFRCLPAQLDFADAGGADHLEDAAGNVISLDVHVVDASHIEGANTYIAAYGGGEHFPVDLDDPGVLLETFQTLLGDAKDATVCGE